MNFFGHAVVAGWVDGRAEHVLGSMLPDFQGMVGVPLVEVQDEGIRRGIDFHHRTDDAFHRSPVFSAWTSGALDALCSLGVRRGPARAVAHVAAEMFLDGHLASHPPLEEGYLAALAFEADGRIRWDDGGGAYGKLRNRLTRWGAPRDYQDSTFVLARLIDALSARPALAIADREIEPVAACLPTLQRHVQQEARALLVELRAVLGLQR